MARSKPIPLEVILYLQNAHKYLREECIEKKDWREADARYRELLKAYHIYAGLKKDYRKRK